MTSPIFDAVIRDHGHMNTDDIKRLWHDIKRLRQPEPYHADNPPKGPAMSVIDTIRTDVENLLENHRDGIEHALQVADQVASNPLAQSVLTGFAHVPPVLIQDAIENLNRLEAEFAKITPAEPVTPAAPAEAPNPQIETGVAS